MSQTVTNGTGPSSLPPRKLELRRDWSRTLFNAAMSASWREPPPHVREKWRTRRGTTYRRRNMTVESRCARL